MTGSVAMVNKARGFAIVRDDAGIEYFAHIKEFPDQADFDLLGPGRIVTFEPFHDESGKGNGMRARNVTCAQ